MRESWHGGESGEANSHNFGKQRSSLLPVSSFDCGLFSAVAQQSAISYNKHSCCPRRWCTQVAAFQCCCCHVLLVRCHLERLSWQAAMATVADSCDRMTATLVLRLWRKSVAAMAWWLRYFILIFYSAFFSHFSSIPLQSYLSPISCSLTFLFLSFTLAFS